MEAIICSVLIICVTVIGGMFTYHHLFHKPPSPTPSTPNVSEALNEISQKVNALSQKVNAISLKVGLRGSDE